MTFERSNVQAMTGYASGEQPDQPGVIKLNTNENPYPASPKVADALAAINVSDLRQYPPPTASPLRDTIAKLHGVANSNVIVTNGGDELLRLLIATFVEEDEAIGVAEPSYSLYEVLAAAHGCRYIKFSINPDWSVPADFADTLNSAGVKLCFLVNPHAPSGYLTSVEDIRLLATEFNGLLVVDEAYVDFIDPELGYDSVPLLEELDNLIILRTFSKGYSLAGLRMAYGLGCKTLIDPMQYKTKDSYNTDYIAQQLANAALQDQEYAHSTWQQVREQRSIMAARLSDLGFSCPASQSNFLLATVPDGIVAEQLYQDLKAAGILVRFFKLPVLENKLRITIGSASENQRLLDQLTTLLSESANNG